MQFTVRKINDKDIKTQLKTIGFDASYAETAIEKYKFETLKIFALTSVQANILKQTALSVGCDCATNKHCIDCRAEKSDCILAGSISQLKKVAQKLKSQPFSLARLSEAIEDAIKSKKFKKPKIMGILNITEDSFSDGGQYLDEKIAICRAMSMLEEGADIIDIGAESTRPGFNTIKDETQIKRILPVVKALKLSGATVSIDTRSSIVALEALNCGADMINDISGLSFDPKIAKIAAEANVPLVLTHSSPRKMEDIVDDTYFSFLKKMEIAREAGVKDENIILDIGIGFEKTKEENFILLKRISEFQSLQKPLLVGVSRKSMFKDIEVEPVLRDEVSSMIGFFMFMNGVEILRVHNVKLHNQALKLSCELFCNLFEN